MDDVEGRKNSEKESVNVKERKGKLTRRDKELNRRNYANIRPPDSSRPPPAYVITRAVSRFG